MANSLLITNHSITPRINATPSSEAESKLLWLSCLIAVIGSVAMIGLGQYTYAIYSVSIFIVLVSLFSPIYATVVLISFFPADQLLTGLMPGIVTPGRYLIIYNIVIAIIYQILHGGTISKQIKYQFMLYLMLLSVAILSLIWAENTSRGLMYIGKLSTLVLWSFLIIPLLSNKSILLKLSSMLCFTTAAVSMVFIFGDIGRININDRVILEGLGINSISSCLGFSIAVSAFYIKYSPSKVGRLLALMGCIIIYLGILKMGTRSVALGLPLAFILAGLILNLRHSPKYLLGGGGVIIIFSISFFAAINTGLISEKLADRYLGLNKVDTYTENSRVQLAKWSLNYVYTKNPMGTGAGNEHQVFADFKYKIDLFESHNTLISTMTQFGVIGFMILMLALIYLFYSITLIKDSNYRYFVAVMFLFISFQILKQSLLQTRLYWIPYTTIFCFINCYFISIKAENENEKHNEKPAPSKSPGLNFV